jgi:adenylate cyclase
MTPFIPTTLPADKQLEALLRQRRQRPHLLHEIDAEIRDRFLVTRAVMVLDMSDFSRLTQTWGIIPTLQEIYRLRDIAIPTLEEHEGTVLKAEADNLYAVFTHPDEALTATEQLLARLNATNIHASIGIGYGNLLMVGDRDLYGDEMNLASKLGEDLAQDGEILLTEAAHKALTHPDDWQFHSFTRTISDVTLNVYRLQNHVR